MSGFLFDNRKVVEIHVTDFSLSSKICLDAEIAIGALIVWLKLMFSSCLILFRCLFLMIFMLLKTLSTSALECGRIDNETAKYASSLNQFSPNESLKFITSNQNLFVLFHLNR